MAIEEIWKDVDLYFKTKLHAADPLLDAVLKANAEAGLPAIDVTPNQGKLLYLLAKIIGATAILEIGTLGGYSSIWLARALPDDGKLITLEYNKKHAEVAAANVKKAGLDKKIEIVVGPALETLPTLEKRGFRSFDLIFIDADRKNHPSYLKWALKLARPGTVIVADNVVRRGRILDESSADLEIQGVRRFIDLLSEETRIEATAVQTVSGKGYDGFVIGVVNG
ncbi:O-methyltransferase [Caenibacillus caldisaponilyticus]|uniref:O-methyltransferase n=1 Tax=Caenibacillus caldisaponilyticus TaxID=1674942 RepID=UPI0009883C79|nr:O-methyltransferase [Caenibacillus caldisaponilyticus]